MSWLAQTLRQTLGGLRGQQLLMLTLAGLVGVLSGYAAIGFYLAIKALTELAYCATEGQLVSGVARLAWWHILLVPMVAGLFVGQVLRYMPGQRLYGVAEVIENAALYGGRTDLKTGSLSALATIAALGGGASTGREGPVVHLGATLSTLVTRTLRLNAASARTLLGCGVAAAVAASFNAPIAGALFALEVVVGHYALTAFAPIVVAAIAGTLISHAHLGNFPAFQIGTLKIVSLLEFPAFILLGIACALLALLFMALMRSTAKLVAGMQWLPVTLSPAAGGLLIGALALVYPEILGVGYELTSRAIANQYGLHLLLSLLLFKLAATVICTGFRFGSGVFSPSLAMGALLGASFGQLAGLQFPALSSEIGVYAILGMAGVASAVLGAPISTILIVFEITGNYSLTIAVMITSVIACTFTGFFEPRSFFHQQLGVRGIHLEGGRATYLLRSERVEHHMTRDFFTIQEGDGVDEARQLLMAQGGGVLVVTDETGALVGLVGLDDLAHKDGDSESFRVRDRMRTGITPVPAKAALREAFLRLEAEGEDSLPVVAGAGEDTADGAIVGLIRHRAVMRAYNAALLDSQGHESALR